MDRTQKIVRTSIVGIVMNLVLVAFKMAVGLISGSIAVILAPSWRGAVRTKSIPTDTGGSSI